MDKLNNVAKIVQALMKWLPIQLIPSVIAVVRAALPLPTKPEQLPEWEAGLSVGGPLATLVTDLGTLWLSSSTPSPTPPPDPVLACPGPCPCKEPVPSDDDIWEAITDAEENSAPVVCGVSAASMTQWIALAKVLWDLSEPILVKLLAWVKSLSADTAKE